MAAPRSAALYPIQVLVAYDSPSEMMSTLAERIAEGARMIGGVEARLLPVDERFLTTPAASTPGVGQAAPTGSAVGYSQLAQVDAIIVGIPAAPLGADGSPVQRLFGDDHLAKHGAPAQADVFRNKVGAAFPAVEGVSGQVFVSLTTRLMDLGMIMVTPSRRTHMFDAASTPGAASGASAGLERPLTEAAQEAARQFGRRVA